MSHEATAWARKQRGLKPTARIVLWELCDRYHPDHGCFPSQETLAGDCELSRSALNDNLNLLEEVGLIRREQRRDERTNRQKSTVYRLAFEADFKAKPSPEIGHGNEGDSVSENGQEPCPENGESRVRNSDTNLVREPVREPVREREGASASEEDRSTRFGTADFEKRVMRFCNGKGFETGAWPDWDTSSPGYIAKQMGNLAEADRKQAEEWRDAYLHDIAGRGKKPVPPGVFLRDRLWEGLDPVIRLRFEKRTKAVTERPENFAPAFGPVHSAMLWRMMARGADRPDMVQNGLWMARQMREAWPTLANFWQQSEMKGGVVADADAQALASAMEFVPVDSDVMRAWRQWLKDHELPDLRCGERGTYLPRGKPGELDDFIGETSDQEAAE